MVRQKSSFSRYAGLGLMALLAGAAILAASLIQENDSLALLKRRLIECFAGITPVTAGAASRPITYIAVVPGATIPGLTGSAAGINGADTNPADYGHYDAPGGTGGGYQLIGGPLLDDKDAAAFVKATQKSEPETGPNGQRIAIDNNYFNAIASTAPRAYLTQLRGFRTAYAGSTWKTEIERIDGACPMAHPTTAEVLQWAANKWGINPILMYAEASVESHWDQTGIGDNGGSSGLFQVSDRNSSAAPYHSFPGLDSGDGYMLARENTCFNADFYAGHLYSAFHGLTGETPPGNIGTALQSWYAGHVFSPGPYTATVYDELTRRGWISRQFAGMAVPY